MKIIQDLKKLKRIDKGLKVFYEICYLFEKEAHEKMIASSNYFFYFLRPISSVVALFIGFLTSGLDFGNF